MEPSPGSSHRPADPLSRLVEEFGGERDVWCSAPGRLLVTGPGAAREVMGNRHGRYVDTSDFFHTRHGVFGPRSAQVEIGRAARVLLHRHLAAHRHTLPQLVEDRLSPFSTWPDAGNLLVYAHLADVLLHRDAPQALRDTVENVIERAVLAGARARHAALSRLVFRRRAMSALAAEIQTRRSTVRPDPRDLLDVVVAGGGREADPAELAEVYLSFVFATVGSIGFALGWAVRLAGTHPGSADVPQWVVREALRLWPVAWLFTRTPRVPHELAGVAVGPGDTVDVCAFLVHRHPGHWEHPDAYLPGRWARSPREPAFLPFGHGLHSCAGATFVTALLEDLVRIIVCGRRLSVTAEGDLPLLGPALAPPRFTAELGDRTGAPGRR
ncbi:cytochrome P450 [Streptomyces sp. NPDC087440]|uniref:cytochrome P450 n=1 Tax=Streptomyces sp. NPDC087440 TaxID=3365790 RepID=UPI00382F48CC